MHAAHPAEEAVRAFWAARSQAAERQAEAGRSDAGMRGAVTAGRHLSALEAIIVNEFVTAGFPSKAVRQRTGIELPGYYRPTKKWDVVVVADNCLVAPSSSNRMSGHPSATTSTTGSKRPSGPQSIYKRLCAREHLARTRRHSSDG